jgi:hypothetical protein
MDFFPQKRSERYKWLKNISKNAQAEAAKIGAPPTDGTALKDAADAILGKMDATDAASRALDGARLSEQTDMDANMAVIRSIVRNWKTLSGYPSSGSEAVLAIKGGSAPVAGHDYKPVIHLTIEAGKVRLGFEKKGAEGLRFYGRVNGGAWERLGEDYHPPYFDTRPLAQAGVPEIREYKARAILHDEEIGEDSDIVSITYGG